MNKTRKEDKIASCGQSVIFVRGKNGIVFSIPNYCNQRGCERCDAQEAYRRKKVISCMIQGHAGELLRTVISDSQWERIGKELSRQGISYVSVMQGENHRLLICDKNPYKRKDIGLQPISKRDAEIELTKNENLFPAHGNRSTGGDWRLTPEREEYSDEICVIEMIPCFISSPRLKGGLTKEFINNIFSHANTWPHGKVTIDNAQQFMDYSMNKAISMAEVEGAVLDFDGCRLQTKIIGKERIENMWSVASVDKPNLTTQGSDARFTSKSYLLQINEIEPYDYIGEYRDYLAQEKIDRLKQELGDLYYVFYPEELDGVYDEAEQKELNKELPF